MTRTLSLKRDVLQELSTDELDAVVGGTLTAISCLTYVSCLVLACLPTVQLDECVQG